MKNFVQKVEHLIGRDNQNLVAMGTLITQDKTDHVKLFLQE